MHVSACVCVPDVSMKHRQCNLSCDTLLISETHNKGTVCTVEQEEEEVVNFKL